MLEELKPGGDVNITDLTRLARSRNDLFWLVDVFKAAEANLKSLKDPWLDIRTDNPLQKFFSL
ncbi:recombinase family protein [Fictibacillus enclensis]|uniref:recombinase family protein n=1 Tax=Fictibacillus enclensis TaxID=1017270 RepID=UPI0025A0AE3A|nr:recombinase family protein [Fictibacillus enclensis]MDM5198966.1 recombinase family protein [Fictibacillus enclensis]